MAKASWIDTLRQRPSTFASTVSSERSSRSAFCADRSLFNEPLRSFRMSNILPLWRPVSAVKVQNGICTAAHGLGVVTEGHCRVGMPRQLGDQSDLDALRLQDRNERMPGSMRGYVRQRQFRKDWPPDALAEILVEEGTATALSGKWPLLQSPRSGKDAMQLSVKEWSAILPGQKHRP